jgi:nitrite reductase (NADH) small subunit/3-phenylpropionate/trans-cinnamate dioxygenase ferredoxin subunit
VSEVRVATLAEVAPGLPHRVETHGRRIVLVRIGDEVHAIGEACSHQGGPLGDGKLSGTRLACPWHGWMYDVRTGRCLFPSRGAAVPSYPVRVDGDGVWVKLDGQEPSAP